MGERPQKDVRNRISFFVDIDPVLCYIMTMLKLSRDHNIYEIWCEYAEESVFIDHKPTEEEIEELIHKNWKEIEGHISNDDIVVEKLKPFYIRVGEKCWTCSGNGYYSTHEEPSVKCNKCKGTGWICQQK